jgi:putative salt-induced outer membrane protein YdiY
MNNKPVAILSAFALISFLAPAAAIADEVVLHNGDRLTGKVVRKEADTLMLTTSYAGDLTIKWSDVRRINTEEPISVYLEDGGKLVGTLRSDEDGSVVVVAGAGAPESAPVPLAKLRFINPSAEISGEGAKVTGHINAGLSSSSGNSQARKYFFDAESVTRTRDNRFTIGGRGARAQDQDATIESNWFGHLKYDHFFSKKWYGYANGDFENDRFKDIRLRSTLGLGSGHQFLETEQTNLSLEGGLTYVHTDFIVEQDDAYPAARWAVKFDHLLFDTKYRFFHAHEAYVGLDDARKMFVRSQTGVRVPLMDKLNATAQYDVDWDNTPSPGGVRTDKTVLLTLGYQW